MSLVIKSLSLSLFLLLIKISIYWDNFCVTVTLVKKTTDTSEWPESDQKKFLQNIGEKKFFFFLNSCQNIRLEFFFQHKVLDFVLRHGAIILFSNLNRFPRIWPFLRKHSSIGTNNRLSFSLNFCFFLNFQRVGFIESNRIEIFWFVSIHTYIHTYTHRQIYVRNMCMYYTSHS